MVIMALLVLGQEELLRVRRQIIMLNILAGLTLLKEGLIREEILEEVTLEGAIQEIAVHILEELREEILDRLEKVVVEAIPQVAAVRERLSQERMRGLIIGLPGFSKKFFDLGNSS